MLSDLAKAENWPPPASLDQGVSWQLLLLPALTLHPQQDSGHRVIQQTFTEYLVTSALALSNKQARQRLIK